MIRAIFFDFYGVWLPNKFSNYLQIAAQQSPEVLAEVNETLDKYYLGLVDSDFVANNFKFKLNLYDIDPDEFTIKKSHISASAIEFMRGLHAHFVKLGVLANFGKQEYEMLMALNKEQQLFEVITGPIVLVEPLLSKATMQKALVAIGEPPEVCLIITADVVYQQFAAGLGIQTLLFETFPKLKMSLEELLASSQ